MTDLHIALDGSDSPTIWLGDLDEQPMAVMSRTDANSAGFDALALLIEAAQSPTAVSDIRVLSTAICAPAGTCGLDDVELSANVEQFGTARLGCCDGEALAAQERVAHALDRVMFGATSEAVSA